MTLLANCLFNIAGLVGTDHDSCDEDGVLLDVVSESIKRRIVRTRRWIGGEDCPE